MLDEPRSPLFPAVSLAPGLDASDEFLIPQLPDSPTLHTSSYRVYVIPTEKQLFVQGFQASEYEDRPPTLLRGSVVVHVLKATKLLKSLTLLFKATLKTDWPEGIPPKKQVYAEQHDLISHTWPFYQLDLPLTHCGADLYVPGGTKGSLHDNVLSLNLADAASPHLAPMESAALFAANLVKRAASPDRLTPSLSRADLAAVRSALSFTTDDSRRGLFSPGFYVYNFEHPIPPLSPESINLTFGRVSYHLELVIARFGAFKTNLVARVPVEVVRIPSENSVEENEPIIIERDWEEHMRYEIVIGGKAVVLDSYVPINFRFIPLRSKVQLHRIRVYITENCNYYCNNKSVHRAEPVKKFLLLEHKAKKNQSLMSKGGGMAETPPTAEEDEVLPRELEFQMFVPSVLNKKYNYCMHPDTSYENIQCDHWLKISLRISREDTENPQKRKHFEILIDSPVHLCSPSAAPNHTLLPSYDMEPDFLPVYSPNSPPMSPGVTPIDSSLQGVGRLLFSAFALGGNSTSNSGNASPVPTIQRPLSPIEFHRIASADDNEIPMERDLDLHLEANLYEPSDGEVLETLGSVQARPFSPLARTFSPLPNMMSPLNSPTMAPSPSLVRRPTVNPPSFDHPGITQDVLPPAYEREDFSFSLSPLRLDIPQRGSSSEIFFAGSSEVGIKDLLNKQLDQRARNSLSDRESIKSSQTSRTSDKESIKTQRSKNGDRDSIKSRLASKLSDKDSMKSSNELSRILKEEMRNKIPNDESIDPLEKQKIVPGASSSTAVQTAIDSASMAASQSTEGEDLAVTDFDVTETLSHLNTEFSNNKGKSRASSVSLLNSLVLGLDDMPLEQTLPLLSLSSTSVVDGGRFLFDDTQNGLLGNASMTDLVDSHYFGHDEHRVVGSLLLLRNPRIKKHYQEPPQSLRIEDPVDSIITSKGRQKSFGVIPLFNFEQAQYGDPKRSSSSSEFTVDEVTSQNDGKSEPFMEPPEFQTAVYNK